MSKGGQARIGISGWTYKPWRGAFYPHKLPHRRELAYVAERMNSVEVNGTFYALQRPASFAAWAEQTPADFVFAVKGGRFITHMKKLTDAATPAGQLPGLRGARLGAEARADAVAAATQPGLRSRTHGGLLRAAAADGR